MHSRPLLAKESNKLLTPAPRPHDEIQHFRGRSPPERTDGRGWSIRILKKADKVCLWDRELLAAGGDHKEGGKESGAGRWAPLQTNLFCFSILAISSISHWLA